MNEELYQKLIAQLNKIDNFGLDSSEPVPFYIDENMNIESLSKQDLYLMHTLLHRFYGRGGNKDLNKQTIEKLHLIIKNKIAHSDFDKLDEVE